MFFSGIADEAAKDLHGQIRAHKELGWNHIEIRTVEGTNFTDLDDRRFDSAAGLLEEKGLQVSCFASQIANWARPVSTDFEVDVAELRRAIPRMQRLGTPFIRCMSYPNASPPLEAAQWRREVIRRLRRLADLAAEGDVTLVHENCDGWGGQGPVQTLDLLEAVASSRFKLVFDTGNPVAHGQDAWEFYQGVRDHVVYVHIKDYRVETGADGKPKEVAVFPGEGKGYVREIIRDLVARGYDGGLSIEPHITSVIHLQQEASDPERAFATYVEYGKRLGALVQSLLPAPGKPARPAG